MNKFSKKWSLVGRINTLVIFTIIVVILGISPLSLSAQTKYTLLEPLPCVSGNGVTCDSGNQIKEVDFSTYVQYVFNLLIALAAVAAVFMIVWGGLQYMSSDSFGAKKDGLKKLENAIYGLLLVLSSFLILRTIDPRLVEIRSDLVKPLVDCTKKPDMDENVICTSKNALGSYFNQITEQAAKYKVQADGLLEDTKRQLAEARAIEENIVAINQKLSAIFDGTVDATQEEINALSVQKAQLVNQLGEKKSEPQVSLAKATFKNKVSEAITAMQSIAAKNESDSTQKIVKTQDDIFTVMKPLYEKGIEEVNNAGGTQKQREAIYNDYLYSRSVIQNSGFAAIMSSKFKGDKERAEEFSKQIDDNVKSINSKITDESVRKLVVANAEDQKAFIQNVANNR